jgi:GTP-binding protein
MAAEKPQNRIVEAQFVAAAAQLDQLPPPQCLEIAFAGRSNVGKSTLMNAVMGRKNLVRTSSTPGCTRTISFFSARMANKTETMLVDLPGYGYAERSRDERRNWATLIESYLLHRPSLRGVILLIDARRDFQEDDGQLLDLLAQSENPNRAQPGTFVVATKLDQIQKSRQAARLRALREQANRAVFGLSALESPSVATFWATVCRDWLSPSG